MCGILAILGCSEDPKTLRIKALKLSKLLRHRGPDWNGLYQKGGYILCHERLGIIDPCGGSQPLLSPDGQVALSVNGEIYNHRALRAELSSAYLFKTSSDCEPILSMYDKHGASFVSRLDGMYSFVLLDTRPDTPTFLVARDHMGIAPLYYGFVEDGSMWFASEMKALIRDVPKPRLFPPGHYYTPETGMQRFYEPIWRDPAAPLYRVDFEKLRISFESAVVKRMMSDVPYGVLLSGGLDSSLVAAVAVRHATMRVEDDERTKAWWPRVHSFAIGLKGSPDLKAAQEAADFLGTQHHTFYFTVEEGIDALRDVIYHLETYDVTTIRASTPMYFLARKIKALGVKMVLSGEGSDEMFGGYLYFDKAPSPEAFHDETIRRVNNLHTCDVLRANKSTMAWGLEVRVPFLDKEFLDLAMTLDPRDLNHFDGAGKRRIEKWALRSAFDTPADPYLPDAILWRQKEQFSDGVGYSWIDGLKAHAEGTISDEEMVAARERFPINPPDTKEAYLGRSIFAELFPGDHAAKTCEKWIPTWGASADPSGRVHSVHAQATLQYN